MASGLCPPALSLGSYVLNVITPGLTLGDSRASFSDGSWPLGWLFHAPGFLCQCGPAGPE